MTGGHQPRDPNKRGWLSRWLAERRERKRQNRIERGFGWVMTSYYLNKHPVSYICDVSYGGSWNMSDDGFDEGVRRALDLLPMQDDDDPNYPNYHPAGRTVT